MLEPYNVNKENNHKEQTYFEYHKVKTQSEIYTIAKEKNVNPNLLAALNGLDPTDYAYENQLLMIPKKDYAYYITKEGDTLTTVAHMFDSNVESLLKSNSVIYLHQGQLIVNKIK